MNHKSVFASITGLFVIGLFSSVVTSVSSSVFYPEIFYAAVFAVLVVTCIVFFKRDDRMVTKNKRQSLVRVIDKNMFIGRSMMRRSRNTLFLRVSIITLLGYFKRK